MDQKSRFRAVSFLAAIIITFASTTQAETTNETKLIQLAKAYFTNDLSIVEIKLLQGAATGEGIAYNSGSPEKDEPTNSLFWTKDRTVRANRIAWLCTDPNASVLVTHRGIEMVGLQIDGDLHLEFAHVPFQLAAFRCVFSGDIYLYRCHIVALSLVHTYFKNLNGDGAEFENDFLLRDGSRAEGQIKCIGATINGSFDCKGSHFVNTNGACIAIDRTQIKGELILNDGFVAEGEVRLAGAIIDGQVNCDNGQFINPGASALYGGGATFKSGILLKGDFNANGEVNFTAATINRNLECDGGHFMNQNGIALIADGADVHGDVFLRFGFSAKGAINLFGSSISGMLDCRSGTFFNPGSVAIIADHATIGGTVALNQDFMAYGSVRLAEASIGGSLNCDGAQIVNPDSDAMNAQGAKIGGAVLLRHGFKAEGKTWLANMSIGNDLDCTDARFYNPNTNTPALATDGSAIGGNLQLNGLFLAEGKVSLAKTTVRGILSCAGGQFINPEEYSIMAVGVNVDGDVHLEGLKSEGEVSLFGATINGTLECTGAEFVSPGTNYPALDLQTARISGVGLFRNVKTFGQIYLAGANIGQNLEFSGAQLTSPNGFTIMGDQATIAGSLHLDDGFKSEGELRLAGAKIGKDVACAGGQFIETNNGRFAINMLEGDVRGSLVLWTNFYAEGNLNFKHMIVAGYFFLNGIKSPDKMLLDLRLARMGSLVDDEGSWPKADNLLLDNFTYDEFHNVDPTDAESRLRWLHRQPANRFLPQPYEQLAGVFRKMGREDDAAEVMIAKNEDYARYNLHWASLRQWPQIFWYGFIGWFSGYGYHPGRAFEWSIGFVLFGWILFYYGHHRGHIKSVESSHHGGKLVFNSFIYSLETFVPLLEFDMARQWKPIGTPLRFYFYTHRIFGWILTTLWIGGLTGLVKT